MFTKIKTIPIDRYVVVEDFDFNGALGFSREQAPPAFLSVMCKIQDQIADITKLVSTMATAREPGYLAHAAGQLDALLALWDDIETTRAEAAKIQ
jgi:hypothetical protein